MSKKKALKCPQCEGDMDQGYLDFRSGGAFDIFFTSDKPSYWSAKGDRLLHTLRGEMAISAHRCGNCRLVIFAYSDAL